MTSSFGEARGLGFSKVTQTNLASTAPRVAAALERASGIEVARMVKEIGTGTSLHDIVGPHQTATTALRDIAARGVGSIQPRFGIARKRRDRLFCKWGCCFNLEENRHQRSFCGASVPVSGDLGDAWWLIGDISSGHQFCPNDILCVIHGRAVMSDIEVGSYVFRALPDSGTYGPDFGHPQMPGLLACVKAVISNGIEWA